MSIYRLGFSTKMATAAAALMICAAEATAATAIVDEATVQHSQPGGERGGNHDANDGGTDHQDQGSQGQRGGRGRQPGETSDSGGRRSLEDIFRDVAPAIDEDSDRPSWAGSGRRGSGDVPPGGEEEDSDRPAWAGGGGGPNDRGGRPGDAGSTRGSLYGDMYVILRDVNGLPILNSAGFVQPIDANGNPIPLDAEGAPIDPSLAIEVEMGRLNVGRSPSQVLDRRAAEVVTLLTSATALAIDAAGRLVITKPDGTTSTIDSPLENLAIYVALMTQGTIPGVTDLPGTQFDHLVDGTFTAADLVSATSFLAAAADKSATVSRDTVAYINAILGIRTVTQGDVVYSNVNYSSYSYDRAAVYGSITVTVLVLQPNGSYVPTQVNIYEAVFGRTPYSASGTFASFAQAVDDARAVISYLHEYEVPAATTSTDP